MILKIDGIKRYPRGIVNRHWVNYEIENLVGVRASPAYANVATHWPMTSCICLISLDRYALRLLELN